MTRAYRLANAGADTMLGAAERFSGDALVREALRDMDHAIDALTHERCAATGRLAGIEQERADQRARIAILSEQASYAMDRNRPDLAERAVATRVDTESRVAALEGECQQAEAARDKADAALTDAQDRRARMNLPSTSAENLHPALDMRVAKAEARFYQARALMRPQAPGIDAISTLQREERIASELATLRAKREKPSRRKR
ncbi:MAG: PspA/IM30 family protein [Sphingomonas bacterium]